MSPLPQEAFYAERPWVECPSEDYEEILKEARSKNVRYLAIDEEIEEDSPGFLEKSKQAGFSLLKEWRTEEQWTVLFQVASP